MKLIPRGYQDRGIDDLQSAYERGIKRLLYVLPTGGGKCLGKGTTVLMYNGTIKKVEDVAVGDRLMGPDSTLRRVRSLASGRETMYRVIPKKGDQYVVNESHILSLRMTNGNGLGYADGEIVNISASDYLQETKTFRHCAKGWRSPADFKSNRDPLLLEPYYLGIWLGDGTSRTPQITSGDPEVSNYLNEYADRLGIHVTSKFNSQGSRIWNIVESSRAGRSGSALGNSFRHYRLFRNKHVPSVYKTASRSDRLNLLAGVLDSDGYWSGNGYDLTLKSKKLIDDVVFVARSLGFAAYPRRCSKVCTNTGATGTYYRCLINGPVDEIPCRIARKKAPPRRQKKNHLVHGIKVEKLGIDQYYGFEIDGDGLFMLGDFTVTHNTIVFTRIAELAAAQNTRTAILVHRDNLLTQASDKLRDCGIAHSLISPGHSFFGDKVAVASVQTLVRRLDRYDFDLIIVDEGHHGTANSYKKIFDAYPNAHVLGVTATPSRSDGRGLNDVYEELVLGPSIADLIDQGYLVEPIPYGAQRAVDLSKVATRMGDYHLRQLAEVMDDSSITGDAVQHYKDLCPGQPAIAFCVNVKHAQDVAAEFARAGFRAASIDGKMPLHDIRKNIAALSDGSLQVLSSCELVSEGTDVPNVSAIIGLRPTKSLTVYLQQVGRGLRPVYAPGFDTSTRDGRLAAIAAGHKPHCLVLDHAGNTFKFGSADEEREWTLEGRKRRPGGSGNGVQEIQVRQCPKCYRCHRPGPKCPACGHVYVVDTDAPDVEEGKLIRLDKKALKALRRREIDEARSYNELKDIGRRRGYAPSWAWRIFYQERGGDPTEA